MPAYFVYVCQDVTDRKELETYWAKIGPTLEGYQPKNIVGYTPFEQLEGEKIEGVAVIEFHLRQSKGVEGRSHRRVESGRSPWSWCDIPPVPRISTR
jgi:hypothetical protein